MMKLFNSNIFNHAVFNIGTVSATRLFNRNVFGSPPLFNTGESVTIPQQQITGGGIPSGEGWTWEYQRRVIETEYYWQQQKQRQEESERESEQREEELRQAIEEQARARKIRALKQEFAVARAERILTEQALSRAHTEYLQALTRLEEVERRRIREEAERVQAEAVAAEKARIAAEEQEIVEVMMMFMMEV